MKTFSLNRPIFTTLFLIIACVQASPANGFFIEKDDQQDDKNVYIVDDINIDDVFCLKADPSKEFVIIDQYDRVIVRGRCSDTMVRHFLRISDPLFDLDNTKYFRLGYENEQVLKQRMRLDWSLNGNTILLP